MTPKPRYPIPDYQVTLDGQDLTSKFRPKLCSFTLTEKRGDHADQLDLVIDDEDGSMAIPEAGKIITFKLGWKHVGLIDKGLFIVDEAEHAGAPDLITVRARSADFTEAKMYRIRREESWIDKPLRVVLGDIASRNGWELKISAELAEKTVPILAQSRESDAHYVTRLARKFDATGTVKSGKLIFLAIGKGETADGSALPMIKLTRRDGDQHRFTTPEREKYTGVKASWHDVKSAKRKNVLSGDVAKAKRLKKTFASEADAKEAVAAEHKRLKRQENRLDFTLALGDPEIYPECRVQLTGIKAQIDAITWLVEQVTHTGGDGGFITQLQMETAP